MSTRIGRKAQIAQLQAENAALRALLAAKSDAAIGNAGEAAIGGEPIAIAGVDETRDRVAVAALVVHHLDALAALADLGYPVATMSQGEKRAAALREFDKDRVHELLREAYRPLEGAKDDLISRQIEIARYGYPEQSAKSFGLLAKVAGWYQNPRVDPRRSGIPFLATVRNAGNEAVEGDAPWHRRGTDSVPQTTTG